MRVILRNGASVRVTKYAAGEIAEKLMRGKKGYVRISSKSGKFEQLIDTEEITAIT